MPEISIQKQCAELENLVACDSFGEPIGDLPGQTDSGFFEEGNLVAGTWQCEPGKLQLDLDITEFCHLLQGHWVLTSESGQVTEIKAQTQKQGAADRTVVDQKKKTPHKQGAVQCGLHARRGPVV